MGGAKPWQIVVMIVALLGAMGSIFYSCMGPDRVKQSSNAHMVDIRSGELFEAPYPDKRPVFFPAKNPKTGDMTLYPVAPIEGKWYLDRRYMNDIKKDDKLKTGLIADGKTGEIVAAGGPTSADIFGK